MQQSNEADDRFAQTMRAYARAMRAFDPIRLHFWDKRGLTMTQLRLMYLVQREGSQPVGQIADALGVRAATATGLTDRLVRHGLIRRSDDASDRRVVRIELTPEGDRVLNEMSAAGRVFLASVLDAFSEEEVATLTSLLVRFADQSDTLHRSSEFRP
jgi:DNA-binding MarR family transcriptional regulator